MSATWTQQFPLSSPPSRRDLGLVYDAATNNTVLFGGVTASGEIVTTGVLGDTWTWNDTNWNQQLPLTPPSPRYGHGMAFDVATNNLVLFGGIDHTGTILQDTWIWNSTNWVQQFPATSPPPRFNPGMAYHRASSLVVLFGGANLSNLNGMNDTWTWNGTNWVQQFPASSPPARYAPATGNHTPSRKLVLFGGIGGSGDLGDTWTWNGTNWTQKFPTVSPAAREYTEMVYDGASGSVVLFGGTTETATFFNDTWTWNGANWVQQFPATSPSPRAACGLAYDGPKTKLVLFGGEGPTGLPLGDTWTGSVSAAYRIAVTASPTSVPADGISFSTITATVTNTSGSPVPGVFVTFRTTLGTLTATTTQATNATGQASDTITSVVAGTATVTVTVLGTPISASVNVTFLSSLAEFEILLIRWLTFWASSTCHPCPPPSTT